MRQIRDASGPLGVALNCLAAEDTARIKRPVGHERAG
jgi:hypothetical protein